MTGKKFSEKYRQKLHEIIFEADTPAGKLFDVILIICIVLSVIMVMLDSVVSCHVSNDVRLRRIFFFPQGAPEGA